MSERRLVIAMTVLAAIGLSITAYLTYTHYANVETYCALSDCKRVQNSDYWLVAGLPVPLIGMTCYTAILVALRIPGQGARLVTAGVPFCGMLYSFYFTGIEIFKIHAVCQWCLISMVLMTTLSFLASRRVLGDDDRKASTGRGSPGHTAGSPASRISRSRAAAD